MNAEKEGFAGDISTEVLHAESHFKVADFGTMPKDTNAFPEFVFKKEGCVAGYSGFC
jgi:hypothetical protein